MRFRRFSPRQKQVLTWWCAPRTRGREAVICDGAVRSGKTLCMGLSFFLWAMARFDGRQLGQDVLRAKLGELTFDVPGVKNYVIDAPAADITISSDVLPWLEGLTISEWGAGA